MIPHIVPLPVTPVLPGPGVLTGLDLSILVILVPTPSAKLRRLDLALGPRIHISRTIHIPDWSLVVLECICVTRLLELKMVTHLWNAALQRVILWNWRNDLLWRSIELRLLICLGTSVTRVTVTRVTRVSVTRVRMV